VFIGQRVQELKFLSNSYKNFGHSGFLRHIRQYAIGKLVNSLRSYAGGGQTGG
jgi:hypothetical protein